MGCCDSSAQLGSEGAVLGAGSRTAGAAASHGEARAVDAVAKSARSAGAWALLFFLRLYMMLLAPFVGGACKFYPSCSNYAYEAVARHGARHGSVLAIKRLLRCRPFTQGGVDLVPEELPEPQGLKPSAADGAGVAATLRLRSGQEAAARKPAADLRGLELRQ
jgi:uncharacterized protein